MKYTEFCRELKDKVIYHEKWNIPEDGYRFYPDGFTSDDPQERELIVGTNVKYHSVESNVLKGDFLLLIIQREDGSGYEQCRFSVAYLYEEYQARGWKQVLYIIEQNILLARDVNVNEVLSKMDDYEETRERLILRPINFSDNRYELKDHVYQTIGDIALVLYAMVYDNERGLGTVKIPKDIFESWGKEMDDVWEVALLNTNTYALPRMYFTPMEIYKPPFSLGAFMSTNSAIKELSPSQVPTITTVKQVNGAIAMFYPGVKERIAELFDSSYYVAFTGTTEVRVHHKDSISPRTVLGKLKSMNKQFPDELLSRKVFYYDKEKKTLTALEL